MARGRTIDLLMSHANGGVIAAIEASGPQASVAVGRGDAVLRIEPVAASLGHNDDLMAALARAFEAIGASPGDLAEVRVSIGPGGFTGLRIAVATAKMLALATRCRLVAVPESLAAARAAEEIAPGPMCVCLAGKGGQYWSCLDPTGEPFVGQLMSAKELASESARRGIGRIVLTQPAERFADLVGAAQGAGLHVLVVDPSAAHVWTAGADLAAGGAWADPAALCPLYPREPEAVRLWQERRSRSGRAGQ